MTKLQMAEILVDRYGGTGFGLISREQAIKNRMRETKPDLERVLARPVRLMDSRALSY